MKYDVIIIGGGAAGMSTALWCDDLGLSAVVLETGKEFGGQLLWTYNAIENHLGILAANGTELRDKFAEQIVNRRFSRMFQAEVSSIDIAAQSVNLSDGRKVSGRKIVIATGVRRRKLKIPGEDDFNDRGMLVSGKVDAEKVKGKIAAVIGGGDAAVENALILSKSAEKVFLIHRRAELSARAEFVKVLGSTPNIVPVFDVNVRKIGGKSKLETLELEHNISHDRRRLKVNGLLVRIGVEPNSGFLKNVLEMDKNGYISVSATCETSAKDIYAVGDVANPISPTVSTAVGSGATAAKSVRWALND